MTIQDLKSSENSDDAHFEYANVEDSASRLTDVTNLKTFK